MRTRSKIVLLSLVFVIAGITATLTGYSVNRAESVYGALGNVSTYDITKPEGTDQNPFTILEVVPNYAYSEFGYLIDGQEPIKVGDLINDAENATNATKKDNAQKLLDALGISGSVMDYKFADEFPGGTPDPSYTKGEGTKPRQGYYRVATAAEAADSSIGKYVRTITIDGAEIDENDFAMLDGFPFIKEDVAGMFKYYTEGADISSESVVVKESGYTGDRYDRVEEDPVFAAGSTAENLKNYIGGFQLTDPIDSFTADVTEAGKRYKAVEYYVPITTKADFPAGDPKTAKVSYEYDKGRFRNNKWDGKDLYSVIFRLATDAELRSSAVNYGMGWYFSSSEGSNVCRRSDVNYAHYSKTSSGSSEPRTFGALNSNGFTGSKLDGSGDPKYVVLFNRNNSDVTGITGNKLYYVVDREQKFKGNKDNFEQNIFTLYTKELSFVRDDEGEYMLKDGKMWKASGGAYEQDDSGEFMYYKNAGENGFMYEKKPDGAYVYSTGGNVYKRTSGNSETSWRLADQDDIDPSGTYYIWQGIPCSERIEDVPEYPELRDRSLIATPRDEEYWYRELVSDVKHKNEFLKYTVGLAYKDNDIKNGNEVETMKFGGWFLEKECINQYKFDAPLTDRLTLYAKWTPMVGDKTYYSGDYNVTFYRDGSLSDELGYKLENVDYRTDLSALLTKLAYIPRRSGYVFKKWKISEDSGKNRKVYAEWEQISGDTDTYTVSFKYFDDEVKKTVYSSGEICEDGAPTGNYISGSIVDPVTASSSEDIDGKLFMGWFRGSDQYDFSRKIERNVNLEAKWLNDTTGNRNQQYTIRYDANRPTGSVLNQGQAPTVTDETRYDIYKENGDGKYVLNTEGPTAPEDPVLQGNVEVKISDYRIEVKTVKPSDMGTGINEWIDKANLIVFSNDLHSIADTELKNIYLDNWGNYGKYAESDKTARFTKGTRDITWNVAVRIFERSNMSANPCPVIMSSDFYKATDIEMNVNKLFTMLQAMDSGVFYNAYLKKDAGADAGVSWNRVDYGNGKYNNRDKWNYGSFIPNETLVPEAERRYYGIGGDTYGFTVSGTDYGTSVRNNCYIYDRSVAYTTGWYSSADSDSKRIRYDEVYTKGLYDFYSDTVDSEKYTQSYNKFTSSDVIYYLLRQAKAPSYDSLDYNMLEIEPCRSYEDMQFWFWYIMKLIPNYSGRIELYDKGFEGNSKVYYCGLATKPGSGAYTGSKLEVRQMSSLEFNGNIDDLNSKYSLIYIGKRTDRFNDSYKNGSFTLQYKEWEQVPNSTGGFYAYAHTGKIINGATKGQNNGVSRMLLGVLGGDIEANGNGNNYTDSHSVDKYCFPGNDITQKKMNEIIDYCNGGRLLVFGSGMFRDTPVSGENVETEVIDNSSNVYRLMRLTTGNDGSLVYPGEAALNNSIRCYTYADASTDYYQMRRQLLDTYMRIEFIERPREYTDSSITNGNGIITSLNVDNANYVNPNYEDPVFLYKFKIRGADGGTYRYSLRVDLNADGRYDGETETLSKNKLTDVKADSICTIRKTVRNYVGILPWRLEIYKDGDYSVRCSIDGMSAIKAPEDPSGGERQKVEIKILQITSTAPNNRENAGYQDGFKNIFYLPEPSEIEAAKVRAYNNNNGARNKTIREILSDNKMSSVVDSFSVPSSSKSTGLFWMYTESLADFKVTITRATVDQIYNNPECKGADGNLNTARVAKYLDKFNMIVLGYADCYRDIERKEVLDAINIFIDEGKSVLFTHDTSSAINTSKTAFNQICDAESRHNDAQDHWGYNINRYYRNILGMDRYGATLIYPVDIASGSGKRKIVGGTNASDNYSMFDGNGFYGIGKSGAAVEEVKTMLREKDTAYAPGTKRASALKFDKSSSTVKNVPLIQGYTPVALWYWNSTSAWNGFNYSMGNRDIDKAVQTNSGQLTRYPYKLPEKLNVAETHGQYYQLDLEAEDIVVWYCLGNTENRYDSLNHYNHTFNDARCNYYIYNKGNITYSGVGHSGNMGPDEVKLFVNTMIAAYSASAVAEPPEIINADMTTGADGSDYIYVDYDINNAEVAIGDGVSGNTKDVFYYMSDSSVVTNKQMTLYIYDFKNEDEHGVRIFDTKPREITILPRESSASKPDVVPVFIVTDENKTDGTGEKILGNRVLIDNYSFNSGRMYVNGDNFCSTLQSDGSTDVDLSNANKNGYYINCGSDGKPQEVTMRIDYKGDGIKEDVQGVVFMTASLKADEMYKISVPIDKLSGKDILRYNMVVQLRYGRKRDKLAESSKEMNFVRRGLFQLD